MNLFLYCLMGVICLSSLIGVGAMILEARRTVIVIAAFNGLGLLTFLAVPVTAALLQ